QGVHLLQTMRTNVLNLWQLVDQLALFKDRLEHLLCVHVFQRALLPGCQRIKNGDGDWILGIQLLIVDADIVGDRHAVLVKEAVQLLKMRIGDLLQTFANLDLWNKFAVLLDRYQLVYTAKDRIGLAGNQALTDAEAVDLCTLNLQIA